MFLYIYKLAYVQSTDGDSNLSLSTDDINLLLRREVKCLEKDI